jgi:hypothetical protein
MTTLFHRIKPAQKFHITKRQIAKFLRIPESLIVKVESWSATPFFGNPQNFVETFRRNVSTT